ncbi:hypothetical protein LFT44_17680 [Arthrobacter sp. FW306-05-C]|uniref:hypothetical protein n=1 Tax=Arthrobacter sp. FW306-05-C TaxID=2879620 RepID=UPI001F3CE649|nr:hypothetical protein [Arthrobacter sp. FW306-05-C]UKA66296.1 hypothetical protein LFT44_17680 [Arthrobacter sp. FW306-05-C]
MTDSEDGGANDPFDGNDELVAGTDPDATPEAIAEDVRHDIQLGHVQDDVSHVLEERFEEAGIKARPEEVDDLAEEIEREASS